MTTYSPESQINFLIQWFKNWSEVQKDDFVSIMAQKCTKIPAVNGICNGIQKLDTSDRPPSLFSCQVKLFNEWWENWTEADREKWNEVVKEADSKFWQELESELDGKREKLNEDFMIVNPSDLVEEQKGGVADRILNPAQPPPVFNVRQVINGCSVNGNHHEEGHDQQQVGDELNLSQEMIDETVTSAGGSNNENGGSFVHGQGGFEPEDDPEIL